jgi:hypothetical protein
MLSQNQDLLKPFAFTPLLVPLTKEETVPAFDIPIFRMWFFLEFEPRLVFAIQCLLDNPRTSP